LVIRVLRRARRPSVLADDLDMEGDLDLVANDGTTRF
jgi:hypothetical protein